MTRRKPEVVVWDLGNVLIPWNRMGALLRVADDRRHAEDLAHDVFTLEVNELLDMGHPVEEVRAAVVRDHPELGWVVDGYVEHFRHSLGEGITGSAELVDELLADGVRCVGLSNWSAITFEGVADAYPVLHRLEGIVISGEEGICKPDPRIYRTCEQRFGFAPDDALFVDDSAPNVDAALEAGWDSVHFIDPDQLRDDLSVRGLLAPATRVADAHSSDS